VARIDQRFFMRIPDDGGAGSVVEARLLESGDGVFVLALRRDDAQVELVPGCQIIVHYYRNRGFVRQAAQIESAEMQERDGVECRVVAVRTVGGPIGAESRECFRVSTVAAELFAVVGDGERCPVLDVSASGLAFLAAAAYAPGDAVPIFLSYEDHAYSGTAIIKSRRELRDGRFRYGAACARERSPGDTLSRGLQRINVRVQQEHLSSLARHR
jgi:hypothetical protein